MSEVIKARRTEVRIGSLVVNGFMLPDGTYRMSQTQSAETVGLSERNARDFLNSKALKALLGEGYTPATSQIEIDSSEQVRGQTRFNALPLDVVSAYWQWQSHRGNKAALSLCIALVTETLERRFDNAFGVERTEEERNQRLQIRVGQLELDLEKLSEAYSIEDDIRQERDYFERLLKDRGIDPYALPSDKDE
ncbi:MAG: hypothetical protein AAF327_14040 [Cyanobacteria bacterium P01_A01_bin.37]